MPLFIAITVNELPIVLANASYNEICLGESLTLSGSEATDYEWAPADIMDGVALTGIGAGT